jgi:hypothetical protein
MTSIGECRDAKPKVKNFDANSTYVGFPEFCCIACFDVLMEAIAYRRISKFDIGK